jgi:arsenite oxidase large subunit
MATDQTHADQNGGGLTRKQALGWLTVGGAAIALPKFLQPSDAAAAGEIDTDETMKLFLGQDELPIPPANAKRYTMACQFCNVGCGYIAYTWAVKDTPNPGELAAVGGEQIGTLGDWVSPAFVTRRDINGVDSYVAVVPDKDCVVNRGDHSPRGGTNALTVYTDREHPLTKPSERLLKPQIRESKGGSLSDASWDDALDLVADKLNETLTKKGPSAIGLWGADHLSAEKNFTETRLFFAKPPLGLYDAKLGPDKGVAVRAIHNRAKWNSEHPSIGEHFGSNSTLLYSYSDFENADTILLSGANSYETGTVLYNRMHAVKNKKVVIDPRKTVPAANAEDGGGLHLQLKPGTDLVLINSLMNVILAEDLHDPAYINARVNTSTFEALKKVVSQDKYRPENTEKVTGVPAAKVRQAAKMVGHPNKTAILFEKGLIWQGTQNEEVMSTYANLALLLGSVGREGQVFGRQGGHQDAYMFDFDWPHPQADGNARRNLWHELENGTIDFLLVTICNPLRMSQQTKQLRQFVEKVPFVVEINIRPSDMTEVADVVLPSTQWGEYTYTRANLERRLRINEQFCDPPGEARADYLIIAQIAQRFAQKHGRIQASQWQFPDHASVYDSLRNTKEGVALGLNNLSRDRLKQLGTNGIQIPITKNGGELVGTKRAYEDKFLTPNGKANFVPRDQSWTDADPLAFLPEEIKPNDQYPLFVTTVRYQAVWQSGYTYRWTHDLAKQVPFQEITVNPQDADKLGIKDGDWVRLENQHGSTDGVANVSEMVQPGLVSAVFGWQAPTDAKDTGEARFYANNLVIGGPLQQKSNAAFFKNTRAKLSKLDRGRVTADSEPTMSFQDRTIEGVKTATVAGNPQSKAKDRLSVPATPAPNEPPPQPDFEAGGRGSR